MQMTMRMPVSVAIVLPFLLLSFLQAAEEATLEQIIAAGAARSKYLGADPLPAADGAPEADLEGFRNEIAPILAGSCTECHGPKKQKAKFRVDTLDPDLVHGKDADWWLEVMDVLSNGEMPPEDGPELADGDRNKVIAWLSSEIQIASQVRRAGQGHSSFRRMTRYEYNYALQDLLGLELDFAKNLPPDPVSEDGFKNSSEMLQMSASQYADYLELNRKALNRATVRGERPEVLYWGVSAERASTKSFRATKSANEEAETREQADKVAEDVAVVEGRTTRTQKLARRRRPPGSFAGRSTHGRPRRPVPKCLSHPTTLPCSRPGIGWSSSSGIACQTRGHFESASAHGGFLRGRSCSQSRSGFRLAREQQLEGLVHNQRP